eukprot:466033_1
MATDTLKELLVDHIKDHWSVADWHDKTTDVLEDFYSKHNDYPEDEYGDAILNFLFDKYPMPDVWSDSEKKEQPNDNIESEIIENTQENIIIENTQENVIIDNTQENVIVQNEAIDAKEQEEVDEAHLLDSIDTLTSFLDSKYQYNSNQLSLFNRLRQALVELGESSEICDCGYYRINGYHGNNKCAGCLLKYFINITLSSQIVMNDPSILREADKYYETFIEDTDRVSETSKCIELSVILYLEATINLIGSCPVTWIILQGKPTEPRWETTKSLDYLKYFRSTIITNHMNREYGKKAKWMQLSNCVKELVAVAQIHMFRKSIYLPVANRHEYKSEDGSFNKFFRFYHEILQEKIQKQRLIDGVREPTYDELKAKFAYTSYKYYIARNKLGIIQSSSALKDYMENTMSWQRRRFVCECDAYTSKSSKIYKLVKQEIKEKLLSKKIPEEMFEEYKY